MCVKAIVSYSSVILGDSVGHIWLLIGLTVALVIEGLLFQGLLFVMSWVSWSDMSLYATRNVLSWVGVLKTLDFVYFLWTE